MSGDGNSLISMEQREAVVEQRGEVVARSALWVGSGSGTSVGVD